MTPRGQATGSGKPMHRITEHANTALNQLFRLSSDGPLEDARRLVPGIWFSIDSRDAPVTGHVSTTGGMLLNARLMPPPAQAARRWCTLNIDLGAAGPEGLALLGFACRARARQATTLRAAVRSFRAAGSGASGFEDAFFPDLMVAFADDSTHCDLLWVDNHPALRAPAEWRTLMLFLDPAGFDIVLSDLRVFAA